MRKFAILLAAAFVWLGLTPTSVPVPFGSEASTTAEAGKLNYYRTPVSGPWCEHKCDGACCETPEELT